MNNTKNTEKTLAELTDKELIAEIASASIDNRKLIAVELRNRQSAMLMKKEQLTGKAVIKGEQEKERQSRVWSGDKRVDLYQVYFHLLQNYFDSEKHEQVNTAFFESIGNKQNKFGEPVTVAKESKMLALKLTGTLEKRGIKGVASQAFSFQKQDDEVNLKEHFSVKLWPLTQEAYEIGISKMQALCKATLRAFPFDKDLKQLAEVKEMKANIELLAQGELLLRDIE